MKHYSQLLRLLLVALSICAFSAVIFAQEVTGSLNGTVKDATGGVVSGATVTISDSEKKVVLRTTTTNNDGQYSAPNIPSGVYDVTVEAPNFKKHIETGLKLNVSDKRTVDVTLEAGNISEVVTVEAAPLAVQLNTPTAVSIISGEQVRELSLNNRNWVQLVALSPGVSNDLADQVYVGTTNPAGQANTINVSVNGARSAQNTFRVDGADITDRGSNITIQAYPSVDSIGEFNILRSLYPAESGGAGGGLVNIVTRSGGEDFHGSAYEFWRNEKMNANDYLLNTVTGTPAFGRESNGKAKRPPFRYHNFGGTIGGPIYFFNFGEGKPGGAIASKLERTFFFFSEEARRDLRYSTLSSTVPDAAMRQGIFPIDICLSANTALPAGSQCTNILPAGVPISSRVPVSSVAQQYLTNIYNKLPLPTDPVSRALLFPAKGISNFRQEILKIDHTFSSRWSMYYRYENDQIPTIDANSLFSSGSGLPGVSTTSTNSPGKTHTFQSTHVISPSFVLVGRYTYGYGAILSENIGTLALVNSPITPPLPFANQRDRVPTISGNGFSALQSFGPYDNFSYKHNFSGDATWNRGNHTIKFGGVFGYYRKNENALAGNNEGIYNAFNNSTSGTSVQSPQIAGQDTNAARRANFQLFANFLQGNNVNFTQAHFDYTADLRQKVIEGYAQDEFRIRPSLTLYYGLRYSFFGSPYDKNNRLSNFDPALYSASAAPQVTGAGNRVVGTGNFCNGITVNSSQFLTGPNNCTPTISPLGNYVVDAPTKNLGPRVGLAWDPFGKGKTSIRTGYGIFYDQVLNGTYEQNIGVNPPFQETVTITGTRLDQPLPTGQTPQIAASRASISVRAIQTNWHDPYMQHWSFDIQHQLNEKTMITAGYFGSKGTHLIGAFELNELPPGLALKTQCVALTNDTQTLQTPGVATVPCQPANTAFLSSAATNILDQIRPYRGYRSITMIQPRFNSNYNSLQISVQRRFSGSSQINGAYTWAKNLTDNQTDRSTAPENSYDISLDRGRATLDRRHVATVNYIYELPWYTSQQGFVGKALGGWQASGIVTLNTGLPFTVTTSNYDAAGLGNNPAAVAGNRPNVLCDPNASAPQTRLQYFNIACFQVNPAANPTNLPNTPGNSPRGIVNGPPTKRVDFTMTKILAVTEGFRIQLRGEAFNIFNHTNFRALSTNITAATFGQVTTVRDPRTVQLGIKLLF
jgi:hypothetical protein